MLNAHYQLAQMTPRTTIITHSIFKLHVHVSLVRLNDNVQFHAWETLAGNHGSCIQCCYVQDMDYYASLTKREVETAGYWPSSFCVFMDRDEIAVNKNAKKNEDNIWPS